MFPPDWTPIIPIFMTQLVWVTVIIVVTACINRALLRREGDRVMKLLTPFLRRVEHLGFISSEQAAMNASALERVILKQVDAVVQVDGVPKATADLVADNTPVDLKLDSSTGG